jgi:predicted RNA binding protein YcfA (HicA-like mRNA interferase family)
LKRRALIAKIEALGCRLIRHGAKHDWYQSPTTKMAQAVPRHSEIGETLALHILKKLSDGQ